MYSHSAETRDVILQLSSVLI